jgi:hypothetical protein
MKGKKIEENFGENSGEISEIPKIPGRTFPGKFPENSGGFFRLNVMLQSVNLVFYFCKK